MKRTERQSQRDRRGVTLIAVMWILIVLASMCIMLAQTMQVELQISGNNLSQAQADAIERGAEQFVLAQVDPVNTTLLGDPYSITYTPDCEARPVGDGYFWIMSANPDNPNDPQIFAITDECSKLNLNTATAAQLVLLPVLADTANSTVPASIVAWRGSGKLPAAGATVADSTNADMQYYSGLPSPYKIKNTAFESVDELRLVKGLFVDDSTMGTTLNYVDPLYGYDKNQNGFLDFEETNATPGTQINASQDGSLGFAHYVTAWSNEPAIDLTGTAQVNINTGNLSTLLQNKLPARAAAIQQLITRGRPFRNIVDFYVKTGMTAVEFATIADNITMAAATTSTTGGTAGGTTTTTTPTTSGLINITTASATVLATLPGLTSTDVQALISKRESGGVDLTNVAWITGAITQAKAVNLGALITARSFQYSADIVAVSGDGRSFKRVRIVVDTQTSPPKLLYRKDLTNLGWPLDPQIRESLRAGNGPNSGQNQTMKGGT